LEDPVICAVIRFFNTSIFVGRTSSTRGEGLPWIHIVSIWKILLLDRTIANFISHILLIKLHSPHWSKDSKTTLHSTFGDLMHYLNLHEFVVMLSVSWFKKNKRALRLFSTFKFFQPSILVLQIMTIVNFSQLIFSWNMDYER
jgi:hypothetical protein